MGELRGSRATPHLLSHPGQSALASNSRAAFLGGRSHSSWLPPGERRRRTRPGSKHRLYQNPKVPFKKKKKKNCVLFLHISESTGQVNAAQVTALL